MCVKQFYGYTCGHCSIPTLIPCPLVASNPFFPTCGFPAERPVFTGEYCHACFRVLWNAKVLKDEEEHRALHLRGECACEVRFEGEDQAKILKEETPNGQKEATSHVQLPANHGVFNEAALLSTGNTSHASTQQQQQWQAHALLSNSNRLGFQQPQEGIRMTNPNQSYTIAIGTQDAQSQLMMGEVGSGMKWYPNPPPMWPQSSRPRHKAQRGQRSASAKVVKNYDLTLPELVSSAQDGTAAAILKTRHEGSTEPQQPVVVSSDLAELEST